MTSHRFAVLVDYAPSPCFGFTIKICFVAFRIYGHQRPKSRLCSLPFVALLSIVLPRIIYDVRASQPSRPNALFFPLSHGNHQTAGGLISRARSRGRGGNPQIGNKSFITHLHDSLPLRPATVQGIIMHSQCDTPDPNQQEQCLCPSFRTQAGYSTSRSLQYPSSQSTASLSAAAGNTRCRRYCWKQEILQMQLVC